MAATLRAPGVATAIRAGLFLLGVAILIVLVVELDVDAIVQLVVSTGWHFVVILLLYCGNQAARAASLWLCQAPQEAVPYRDVLGIRLSAEAVRILSFTGPVLAEPSKVWLLRTRGLAAKESIAAITAELVAYSLMTTTMSSAALGYLLATFEVSPLVRSAAVALIGAMGIYITVAILAIALRVYLIGAAVGVLVRLGLLRFARDDVRSMEDALLLVLRSHPARLASILTFQVVANVFLMGEVYVALRAMGLPIPIDYPFLIEGGLKFVGVAFFFIPTQVGVSEGAYAVLFGTLGLPAAAGVSLAFIRRLRTLATAALGLAAIAVLSRGRARP